MLSLHNSPTGDLQIRWPQSDTEIIALGAAYIAYEATLSPVQQLKDTTLVVLQTAYTTALTAAVTAGSKESRRAQASETLRQHFQMARPLLEQAFLHLKTRYYANLAQLEDWGLDTVASSRGVKVRKPKLQNEWFAFLHAYVLKEASLSAEDRLTIPTFAQMQALDTAIQTALTARIIARTQRGIHVHGRNTAAQRLLELLQVACHIRVALTYNGLVTTELEQWGFVVESRPPRANGTVPDGTPMP